MIASLKKTYFIAQYTFREIFKSKILLNVFLLGLGTLVVTYVAFSFTYGEAARVALDFGMGTLSLSSVGIAIFIGVGLLSKEIENRTVYMIISRPVARYNFILGKILGLVGILVVNIFLLSFLTLSLYFLIGGEFYPLIIWSIVMIVFEAILVLLVVNVFSLLTTPTLSVLLTMVVYIAGHAISEAKLTLFAKNSPIIVSLLDFYHYILPAFYKLNIKDYLIYNKNLSLHYLTSSTLYAVSYSLFLIFLAIFIFERKNLD